MWRGRLIFFSSFIIAAGGSLLLRRQHPVEVLWQSSGTAPSARFFNVCVQADGNFVVYNDCGFAVWGARNSAVCTLLPCLCLPSNT